MTKDLKTMCELLPCPWCGSEAKIGRNESGFALAFCTNENCFVEPELGSRADDVEISKAWNTRSDATIIEYQRREKIAREALEFYAAHSTYEKRISQNGVMSAETYPILNRDCGQVAQQALKQLETNEGEKDASVS